MTIKKISAEELLNKKEKESIVILDVRAIEKYKSYHIAGENIENIHIPKTTIFDLEKGKEGNSVKALPKNREIIITCTTGNSATKCASILSKDGYNVTVLDGGITAWKESIEKK